MSGTTQQKQNMSRRKTSLSPNESRFLLFSSHPCTLERPEQNRKRDTVALKCISICIFSIWRKAGNRRAGMGCRERKMYRLFAFISPVLHNTTTHKDPNPRPGQHHKYNLGGKEFIEYKSSTNTTQHNTTTFSKTS